MNHFAAKLTRPTRVVAAASALLLPMALGFPAVTAHAAPTPVGQGFTVTPSDLAFILKQIKIAERHAATFTAENPCGTLVGPGPDQIPDALTSFGLRTVDGSCNNLIPGRERFASADQPFPRYASPVFSDAEGVPAGFFGPGSPAVPSSTYAQKKGSVFDSQPRMISNLIADQTSTNPAAVAAAGFPVRTQGDPGLFPCTTEPAPDGTGGVPAKCVPKYQSLFIPNVTTDVGLSPPYNSLFTFFGQFFDHGLDQTLKSGGTVFVPLKADDPLIAGPDHNIATTADNLPADKRFMVMTRAQNQPGPDGILGDDPATVCTNPNVPIGCDESADDVQDASNSDSPWVDQSQTYSSHSSHQVFLREYADFPVVGKPVSTGNLLGGLEAGQTYPGSAEGRTGMATWAAVKLQAATKLGLKLVDRDVTNIPMIAADPYGKFLPGPLRELPQYVTKTGLVEGDRAANNGTGVLVPPNALHFDTPFLTDIAHNADPSPQDTDNNPATPPVPPTPDLDNKPSADFAKQPAGTYDDEMLNAHFSCGDGRCNENIALTSIHQVFHSEHERLVADIKNTLDNDLTATGATALTEWKLATHGTTGWNGERLFQAARFVNEMEYQHLVFGEFARKVQPAIQPFKAYHPDINAAIHAEFAHAVYRFGHSMLDEQVARTEDGVDNSIPLLTAFLNPPEYFNGVNGGVLTPEQAAGSVIMGSSNQVGNELDEFVTETLRNNLVGLPLDLATLNITRAREAGVPPLNTFRRQIFGATNALKPYTSWADFGQNIKHPESLVNFVAAYGQHPSIVNARTLVAKRDAARAIVNPRAADPAAIPPITADVPPADAADFMFSTGTWASNPTGLEGVDLWIGGLAEKTNVNGGLLGSTFNYVFENQLTDLQNGDRFYYLARTPGMNLGSQLEGNSFAEMIQRNSAGSTNSLKADAFATADCKFQLANLKGTAAEFTANGPTVANDPTTECDETALLLRKPNGTIQYRQINTVDPVGVNGQSVYNGTNGVDRIWGGSDNDTFWGGAGNDVIEGGGGDDVALGGDGNDIITDESGADILKGGPGNDALDGGPGLDILLGGDGQDFTNGGANDNQTFGGPGDDFIMAGQGADAVLGDGGDDWIQGGSGGDVLSGDHGAPFLDDPAQTKPGNDIFIGQGGGDLYEAEGGDDVMSSNTAIDTFNGAAGFDWAIHQYDTVGADDDMKINNNLIGHTLPVIVNRDRWQEAEAVSGSGFNDVIRGDDAVPSTVGGAGLTGCDVLDQTSVNRISGLAALLPQPLTGNPAPVVAKSATGFCPLDGGPTWGEGNILLGGAGSDTIEGRGGNDIIDGDKALTVRISVRTDPVTPATEIGSTDLMEKVATSGDFGPGTAGMTLQAAVFAGLVDPGNLVAVREIKSPAVGTDSSAVDTAVFSDVAANYTVTTVPAGATLGALGSVTTVVHKNGGANGTDTLRNIERLQFAPAAPTTAPGIPTIGTATAGDASATVNWTPPASDGGSEITGFTVRVVDAANAQVGALRPAAAGTTSLNVTGLTNGTAVRFQVQATNAVGTSAFSNLSTAVTPTVPGNAPATPMTPTATAGNASATVTWTAPVDDGGSPINGYSVRVVDAADSQVGDLWPAPAGATSLNVTGLTNGTAVRFQVQATNAMGTSPFSLVSNAVTPAPTATAPDAPSISTATAGDASAVASWTPPASNGGSAITGYSVQLVNATDGAPIGVPRTAGAGAVTFTWTGLVNGTAVRFEVRAINAAGTSAASARSAAVIPGTQVQQYVGRVYRDLFNRAPDSAGLAGWTSKLNSGTPRGAVANAITSSPEYRTTLITGSYLKYLGRSPDQAGLNTWLAAMNRGFTVSRMEAGFIASPEYYAKAGNTNSAWVQKLYADVLGRAAGTSEVQHWTTSLGAGASRNQVAMGFLISAERLTTVVNGYYQKFLGRDIDPSGLATWVRKLQAGEKNETIIAGIIGSAEYFSKG